MRSSLALLLLSGAATVSSNKLETETQLQGGLSLSQQDVPDTTNILEDYECVKDENIDFGEFQNKIYFNSKEYIEELTAEEKMEKLWPMLEDTEKRQVICQKFDMEDLFNRKSYINFHKFGDEVVGSRRKGKMRRKMLHQQGLVARVKFVAEKDEEGNTPYTGIFEGADYGIMRLSETDLIDDSISSAANPSFAIKFLRSNIHSANMFTMASITGERSWDFFKKDFTSQLPLDLAKDDCETETVLKWSARGSKHVMSVGSSDTAKWKEDGTEVTDEDIKFPFMLRFIPQDGLPVTDGKSRFFEQLKEDGTKPILNNTTMFEVWALPKPAADLNDPTSEQLNEVKIGEIINTTPFNLSLWGDQRLFFSHTKLEEDLKLRPEWNPKKNRIPKFKRKSFGRWDFNDVIPPIEKQDLLQATQAGCPFTWVINALALKDSNNSDSTDQESDQP